jgi:hypothetical protein
MKEEERKRFFLEKEAKTFFCLAYAQFCKLFLIGSALGRRWRLGGWLDSLAALLKT